VGSGRSRHCVVERFFGMREIIKPDTHIGGFV
jgi:hypothetical protein